MTINYNHTTPPMTDSSSLTGLQRLEAFSEHSGRWVAWLTLGMVLLSFGVIVIQLGQKYLTSYPLIYSFLNFNTQKPYELAQYFHACVFMCGIAYTLKHDSHVRVDIFYQRFSSKQQAWVDLLGCIFLVVPLCVFIFANSWSYVINSWQIQESSANGNGLNLVFLLKSVMLIMPVLLGLQCLAMILRSLLLLRNKVTVLHLEHDVGEL